MLGSVRVEHEAKKWCVGRSKVKATQTWDAEWEVVQGGWLWNEGEPRVGGLLACGWLRGDGSSLLA